MSQLQSNTFSLIEKLSLYSPLIIVTSVFLVALFTTDIAKGLAYIVFVVIATALRHTIMHPNDKITQQVGEQLGGFMKGGAVGNCNMGINKYGDNNTFSSFIITFTAAYICLPMFLLNEFNFNIVIFFVFYGVSDFFIKSANKCFVEQDNPVYVPLLSNIVSGLALGMLASSILYSYKNNWSFVNVVPSDKQVCSMPSEQTFKCGVYKNGEMLAST